MKLPLEKWFRRKSPDLRETRSLGGHAKALWENEAFKRAVEKVRFGIVETWANSPIADHEGQHELRLMLKLLDDVEGNIRKEMNDGAAAEKLIIEQEEKDKRTKNVTTIRR